MRRVLWGTLIVAQVVVVAVNPAMAYDTAESESVMYFAMEEQVQHHWAFGVSSKLSPDMRWDEHAQPFIMTIQIQREGYEQASCASQIAPEPEVVPRGPTVGPATGSPSLSPTSGPRGPSLPNEIPGFRRSALKDDGPQCRRPTWAVRGPIVKEDHRSRAKARSFELLKEGKSDFHERSHGLWRAARRSMVDSRNELLSCFDEVAPGRRYPGDVTLHFVVDESGEFQIEKNASNEIGDGSPEAQCVARVMESLHVDLEKPLPQPLVVSFEVYAFDVRLEEIEVEAGSLEAEHIQRALEPVLESLKTEAPKMLPKRRKDLNLAKGSLRKLSFVMVIDDSGRVRDVLPTRLLTLDLFEKRLLSVAEEGLKTFEFATAIGETVVRVQLLMRCF